jgi:3-oxoacyl-[acyl-carrier protein] reductase
MDQPPVVFISGASRGIGAAIARRLAASGYDIWLNYHSSHEAARSLQKEIEGRGRKCMLLPFDVADEEAISAALEPLLAEEVPYGFVHNAGITRDGLLPLMGRKDWDRVLDTHLTGFFLLGRLLAKAMVSRRKGRIIAIGSVSGETGQAGQANYAAAKAGLAGACKSMARELARRNILVNVVSPGLIATEMIKDLPLDKVLPLVPLNRVGTVEEVAGIVNFLLGPEAGYITGQVIGVNGGLHM